MARSLRPVALILALTAVAALIVAATLGIANSQTADGKFDVDGDGLIEVSSLEQLNAIRYDLDGDGQPDTNGDEAYADAFPIALGEAVCNRNCKGYELARSLDFDRADSYASGVANTAWTVGSGWLPIGFDDNPFDATFEGNEHTITNLYIRRVTILDNPGSVGLFGDTGVSSIVSRIGLVDVDVTGYENVGGLAGMSSGSVIRSYVTGRVSDHGWHAVGGLIGYNRGPVTASYSAGDVSGRSSVGGRSETITALSATVTVPLASRASIPGSGG